MYCELQFWHKVQCIWGCGTMVLSPSIVLFVWFPSVQRQICAATLLSSSSSSSSSFKKEKENTRCQLVLGRFQTANSLHLESKHADH